MTSPASTGAAAGPGRKVSHLRDARRTAVVRCQCYGAFSELTASPHDIDTLGAVRQRLAEGLAAEAPAALRALLGEFAAADVETLKADYSSFFEVGSQGPPVPIREDLSTGQKAGTREDLVRFYDYFGYRLGDRFAWAPDHLSVELEFMHYLCFHEAQDSADRLSYQLAQADFAERHLANWVPPLAVAVAALAPGSLYGRALQALADYVAGDLAWQAATIVQAEEGPRRG